MQWGIEMPNLHVGHSSTGGRTNNYTERVAIQRQYSQQRRQLLHVGILVAELVTYMLTFILLFAIRVWPEFENGEIGRIPVLQNYTLFLALFFFIYFLLTYQKHFYKWDKDQSLSEEYVQIMKAVCLSFLIAVGVSYLFKNTFMLSRILLVSFALSFAVEAAFYRYIRKWFMARLKEKGVFVRRVLIIGAGKVGIQLRDFLSEENRAGYEVIGFLDDDRKKEGVIGNVSELERVIEKERIEVLYITIPSARERMQELLHTIYKYHVDIRIIPEMYDRIGTVFEYHQDVDFPYIEVVKTPLRGLNLLIKRIMDRMIAILALLFCSPLFLVIAIAIRIDSPGGVLYKQVRIGKNGLPFYMYKFRSMVTDAHLMQHRLHGTNDMEGPVFKIKSDPRVTRVGRFLRKYSLDELPQLLNVLRGDMSLIGPRPPLPGEVAQYTNHHWRRMDVLPGMTGLWQVSGRSDLDFEQWVDLDIYYIERWSFGLEMKILFKTIPVVLRGTGAY
ncbi:sugar transferase [Cohnella sp. REN36]|uniref:sugar transferase n=1 Tax=Cohnella sp. REN36 TaxID=2887347 RepID=UPI001D142B6A|nr:sugar transferase [Cohnella sp. REN36]MCC3374110.1 sugar transferase [Cohnella sp. REN36]